MIEVPIILKRKVKSDEDQAIVFELENLAKAKGGKLTGEEPTLTELLYNQSTDQMLSLKEVLDN